MVSSGILKMVNPCWRPSANGNSSQNPGERGRVDGLMWYKDSGYHFNGEFSMAVIQANSLLEDQSQIESGPLSWLDSGPHGTFVGVYDGHGGPETSRFINKHMFNHLKKFTSEQRGMSADAIYKAFSATEEGFLSLVAKQWLHNPQLAAVGSCCLIGVICSGVLYVANAGDSRAVLGQSWKGSKEVKAVQLSAEHNASIESVREELCSLHPGDSQIVVLRHNVWRVKGIIQVSRSIGDAYLKKTEFNRAPLVSKFQLPEPFHKPILSYEPSVAVHQLLPHDQFLIFASDGLWEHMSNQEAVDIVHNYPRNISHFFLDQSKEEQYSDAYQVRPSFNLQGIARRLIKVALQEAAKKKEMRYSDLKKIDRGVRRHFHDDITVIVLFLNNQLNSKSSCLGGPTLSIRGGVCIPDDSLS